METYYVKTGAALYGVPDDSVERFAQQRALALVEEGKIEPFDATNKKHAAALARQERESADRKAAAEELLKLERENPAAYQAREMARRKAWHAQQLAANEARARA